MLVGWFLVVGRFLVSGWFLVVGRFVLVGWFLVAGECLRVEPNGDCRGRDRSPRGYARSQHCVEHGLGSDCTDHQC